MPVQGYFLAESQSLSPQTPASTKLGFRKSDKEEGGSPMVRLRPRDRPAFSGFTKAEIEKMEKVEKESRDRLLDVKYCKKIAISFNRSAGRTGKPAVNWTEVHNWFQSRQHDLQKATKNVDEPPNTCSLNKTNENFPILQEEKIPEKISDISESEFEAMSSKDGAWYDVDMILTRRIISTGEAEVRVRFVGYGAEEDEWVDAKNAVRIRSLPLEHSECYLVKVGDLVLCFQERRDQAIYYDAHVMEIERRMHDIRGCRCLFLIRYKHDSTEERVRLRRLCRRPTYD